MLQNAYFLAKIGADTAENERNFVELLPKICNYPTGPLPYGAVRSEERRAGKRRCRAAGQPARVRTPASDRRPHAELHRNSLRKYISRAKMHGSVPRSFGSSEFTGTVQRGGRGPGCPSAQRHSPPCPAGARCIGIAAPRGSDTRAFRESAVGARE